MNDIMISQYLLFFGLYLIIQCIHIAVRDEKKDSLICVLGKLLLATVFIYINPALPLCFFGFLAFYPSGMGKRSIFPQLVLQILCPLLLEGLYLLRSEQFTEPYELLAWNAILLFAAVLDAVFHYLVQRNHQLYHQMEQTAVNELKVKCLNEKLSIQAQVVERNTRLEERENIARNIHNVVGHTITSAIVSLEAYEVLKEAKPAQAGDRLSAVSERMHLALEEIRRVVRVMDSETEEVTGNDFCSLLTTELDKFSMDTEITIHTNFAEFVKDYGKEPIEKKSYEFLHSVVAECLNNGIRHGGASEFDIFLTADRSHLSLSISDNGDGFQKLSEREAKQRQENGFGLRKIRDYVQKNAGSLQVDTETGFRVRVTLPRTLT